MILPDIYREALYKDCSDEDIALAHALLTPEPSGQEVRPTRRCGRVRRISDESRASTLN